MLLLWNATNNWTKSWFSYPQIQEIRQVVYEKTKKKHTKILLSGVRYMKPMWGVFITSAQDCVKFCKRTAWQNFLLNHFADFSDVLVKNPSLSFIYLFSINKTYKTIKHGGSTNQDFVQVLEFPYSNISYFTTSVNIALKCTFKNLYSFY